MNILIPHTWLLEHLETSATPEEIQKYLSLSGPSVERIYDRSGEKVYDIEVTTNRVDSMSVRGIAREAAVILSHAGLPSKLKPLQLSTNDQHHTPSLPLPTIINDPKLCKRILCVVLTTVQHAPTPEWMAKRLTETDQNVHDAVIDITNSITHELGHPCHAFDYDKIMKLGGTIVVKEAEKGKRFVTLDGSEYQTVGGEVVFENGAGEIIDLPAIKGTMNTAVDDQTTNLLFWIESIDPKKIRFASMTHAIRTVAAQLNEKHVDPELGMDVLLKGIELYREHCQAQVASQIYDEYPGKRPLQSMKVPIQTIHTYLGVELPRETIEDILIELGCQVEKADPQIKNETLEITPPSFRPNLTIPADIVEEIARIYGYHNLPSVVMDTPIPLSKPTEVNFGLEHAVKNFLAHIGWQEAYTYSMVSQELADQSGYDLDEHVTIQNPLTDDRVYLRRTLIPSLQEVLDQNPLEKHLSVFEMAYVYQPQTDHIPQQDLWLTLLSSKPYRQVKGDVEALLAQLFLSQVEFQPHDYQHEKVTQSAQILVDSQELGQLHVLKNGRVAVALDMHMLTTLAKSHPTYQPIPCTAEIIEDLTFTFPQKTLIGPVMTSMQSVDPLIKKVELKDQYQQNFTFTIHYQDQGKNLSGEDIEPIRKRIIDELDHTYQAKLVGQV